MSDKLRARAEELAKKLDIDLMYARRQGADPLPIIRAIILTGMREALREKVTLEMAEDAWQERPRSYGEIFRLMAEARARGLE